MQFHYKKCIYLGPAGAQKGHKCLSNTGRMYISRHVVFYPLIFPGSSGFLYQWPSSCLDGGTIPLIISPSEATRHASGTFES